MRKSFAWWIALPIATAVASSASAQAPATQPTPAGPANPAPAPEEAAIEFSADQVIYDSNADLVTATGAVRM